MEKRLHPRQQCDLTTSVVINRQVAWCRVKNISAGGAWLCLEQAQNEDFPKRIMGKTAVFCLPYPYSSLAAYSGEIVRVDRADGSTFFGVHFEDCLTIEH